MIVTNLRLAEATAREKYNEVQGRVAHPNVSPFYIYAKRAIDVALGVLLSVVAAPLVGIAAVFVMTDTRGSAFVREERAGKDKKPFLMWRMRTFRTDNENGMKEVTPAGRRLMAMRADMLPAIWNVVRGEMSFVGPEVKVVNEAREYGEIASRRFLVRPGLVSFHPKNTFVHGDVAYDLFYVDNQSLIFDFLVLFS